MTTHEDFERDARKCVASEQCPYAEEKGSWYCHFGPSDSCPELAAAYLAAVKVCASIEDFLDTADRAGWSAVVVSAAEHRLRVDLAAWKATKGKR